ncbi:DUF4232 domain-containing protein [Actinacidiphila oryziradicis]|uniref:DUF4232 domain-containing protein n=1 Tax=Actinacidiphila oryziradicis TaxID=2571141 RepID=A0A4U0SNH3_9ACTN|nr:DUF4232 domain-containing protein [Actinacidiphila oryziradicis]TKA11550.1 DUF4232 domain-containing protein [Actinacidiphila oryziradicis]
MRALHAAATITATAALALGLTACGSSGSSNSSADSTASTSTAPTASATDATGTTGSTSTTSGSTGTGTGTGTGTTGSTGSGTGTTGSTGTGTGTGTGASSRTSRCHTADLAISFATGGDAVPSTTSGDQTSTAVALRNKSGHICTLKGFPGVDLKGSGATTTWSLARKPASTTSFTLANGDTTEFTITFLVTKKGEEGSWTPTTAVVTPPNETTSVSLAWPWSPVLLQDGATHPGTYVGPIGS